MSATSLSSPALSYFWIQPREVSGIAAVPTATLLYCARAAASVSPTLPTSGSVKVTCGSAV